MTLAELIESASQMRRILGGGVDEVFIVIGGQRYEPNGFELVDAELRFRIEPIEEVGKLLVRSVDEDETYVSVDEDNLTVRAKMEPVESSDVNRRGYDRENRVLVVEFDDATYQYYDVPPLVYAQMQEAKSQGKFVHQVLKGKFKFKRL